MYLFVLAYVFIIFYCKNKLKCIIFHVYEIFLSNCGSDFVLKLVSWVLEIKYGFFLNGVSQDFIALFCINKFSPHYARFKDLVNCPGIDQNIV